MNLHKMLLQSEYNILERISLNNNMLLYRAERYTDKQKVILKILENAGLNNKDSDANHEYEVASNFNFKGIARYLNLETYNSHPVAVIADIEGVSLEKFIQENEIDIGDSLKIAIGITEVLQYFFHKRSVHQGLCPGSFLVNTHTFEVTLINFSRACQVSTLSRTIEHPDFLNSSLVYISPEQTGRINGEIDIRSDLYSLGIILYELLTGKVPFEATEALTLIHCHIAKSPLPPHVSNPLIPVALSNIILKLLSKNAGDRYQSPFGLKADLQTCLNQWINHGNIELFELSRHDFSGRLQNPRQFYGREKEIATLHQAYKRVSTAGAVEIFIIEGHSGIGKSALVHQLKHSIRQQKGIFVEGKFNQFQRNTPYFAFIQAFKEFADYILRQHHGIIATWKEEILRAVGGNGRVLTDIIPHLALLIGAQPPVPELESNETQNRFHYVFIKFIHCIAKKDHPLVIFFDDLQWSDAASSNLLKIITTNKELQSFLFVGAYRSNEITTHSMFATTMEEMQKEGCHIQKIILSPLPYQNAEEIINEMIDGKIEDDQSLVDIVYQKSQGNPFFINAFLKCLYEEEVLVFDFYSFAWTWDPTKINRLRYIENIVELMTGRIQKLPGATQELLKIAACLGYHFDLKLLVIVLQQTPEEIEEKLKPAVNEGLVLIAGDSYRYTHDRIQQAAYSLIEDSKKKYEHSRIGKALQQNLDNDGRATYIFEIVNQLNSGIDTISTREEEEELAGLNLIAGVKAKNSAAYKPSFEYLNIGISLLHFQIWEHNYQLALQLYSEGAEAGFLSGNHGLMEEWIDLVLQNAATELDKVRVYEIRIKSYIARQKLFDALQTALQVLELLGMNFPQNPRKIHVLSAFVQIKWMLLGKPLENLIDLPLLKNPVAEAAIRVLISVGAAVYFARPALLPLLTCKLFYLMITYGNSQYSGVICNSYALMLIAGMGDFDGGYRFGKIAAQLSEKYEVGSLKCQSRMMANTFINHWKEHYRNTLEPLLKNYWYGLENGNIEFATYSALVYCHNAFFCGQNLKKLSEEIGKFNESFKGLKHESALNLQSICGQAVLNLHEEAASPTILTGKIHNEEKMVKFYKETRGETALYKMYLYKLIVSFLFEKYDECTDNAREARSHLKSVPGSSEYMTFFFYETLTLLSVFLVNPRQSQKTLLKKIHCNLKIFRKFAGSAPMNGLHKLLLMEAELSRVTGHPGKAGLLYDKAIEEAKKNEYVNDLALACELAGKFFQSQHREFIAQHYFLQSYKFYKQWGAFNKARDMEQKYAYLVQEKQLENALSIIALNNSQHNFALSDLPAKTSSHELDLYSILRAATAISSEIQLDKLLRKLVKIAVENVGAQQGHLILNKEEGFFIEASGSIDTEEEVIVASVPIKGNKLIPEAIIQFVNVTQENLVIDNAAEHGSFFSDPAIKDSKSILCSPIIHQGHVIGLLYFENKLITNAFTRDRIELLKLLSGQIAISLQNALNEQKKMNVIKERENLLNQINLHQQELLKTKLEIQEQTFHNISGEIHDNIGQTLSFIKLNINTIDIDSPEAARDKLFESRNLLTKVIQDLRDLAKTLNTDFIEKLGLANAIDQQLNILKRTGLYTTQLSVNGETSRSELQSELVIFRIVQELLNNIVKHAEATSIIIEMQYHPKKLVITVQDDGKGFDHQTQDLSSGSGLGLRNIHNRLSLVNGTILFERTAAKGTMATIELLK